MVSFNSYREKSFLKNPLKNFSEDVQEVEYRQDPLTRAWTRLNIDRANRPHQAPSKPPMKITEKKDCFFCKKHINDKTPEFSKSVVPEGRIKQGDFVLFPNLFPFAAHHAVGILTENHNASLSKITAKMWADALTGTISWFKKVHAFDSRMRFTSINMNYMMPAAASVIHPHMQATVDKFPTNQSDLIYRNSWEYLDATQSNFWNELCKEDNKRKIFNSRNISWHASFAPKAANEVTGIIKGKSGFLDLTPKNIEELADGLSKVFRALEKLGVRSANMAIFASPLNENLSHFFNMHVVIISRPETKELYTADRGFMEVLHKEAIVSYIPEDFAKRMKKEIHDA